MPKVSTKNRYPDTVDSAESKEFNKDIKIRIQNI